MQAKTYLILSFATVASLAVLAAEADTYSKTTTIEQPAPAAVAETREEVRTVETSPPTTTVIKEQPTTVIREERVAPPVENKTVVIKKHHGHLIQVGPAKVF
jgi:hypothetical protein